jgi:hypothetical protein
MFLTLLPILLGSAGHLLAEPLRLHPDNPHYFLYRGQPLLLITSGEHYGAVLNLDFDYLTLIGCVHFGAPIGPRRFRPTANSSIQSVCLCGNNPGPK